jgi:hypothetical protein
MRRDSKVSTNNLKPVEHSKDERCRLHDDKAQDDNVGVDSAEIKVTGGQYSKIHSGGWVALLQQQRPVDGAERSWDNCGQTRAISLATPELVLTIRLSSGLRHGMLIVCRHKDFGLEA